MTPPTTELAAPAPPVVAEQAGDRRRALADELRSVWRPFWTSRLLVWAVGAGAMLLAGVSSLQWEFDPKDVSISFGRLGNLLFAPAVRWDSIYYLQIAKHGYQSPRLAAFSPFYPLLIRAFSGLAGSFAITGVLISLIAMFVGLVIVRRLTALELGDRSANVTVQLIAFGPMAVFLSAVYTESLFLALSAGTFYAARRGRWASAGILGGLATMTRSGGVLLLAPVLIMYFWGPRSDLEPRCGAARCGPRYPLGPDVLWSVLIPLGALLPAAYFAQRGFGLEAAVHAQVRYQQHTLVWPVVGLWDGLVAGWDQLRLEIVGGAHPSQALFQCGALLITLIALVGVFRRLPLAYGVYTTLGLFVLHLSSPSVGDPLAGFARYASLRFPLFMFAGAWAAQRHRSRLLLVGFGLLLIFSTVQFARWQAVGTPSL
jgi:Mannosyltransferase (PIG-V)